MLRFQRHPVFTSYHTDLGDELQSGSILVPEESPTSRPLFPGKGSSDYSLKPKTDNIFTLGAKERRPETRDEDPDGCKEESPGGGRSSVVTEYSKKSVKVGQTEVEDRNRRGDTSLLREENSRVY